ncbi:MAG TPA: hypothetical protein VJ224_01685 [Thermoplasmata archaeon]|nr:hypothetical protein [Thermoplasmata archaeon]
MVRKKTVSELEQAEIKLQSLLEKRDALNREAQLLRKERDLVHDKKRELSPTLRELKDRRAALAAEARSHRAKRDELQANAKSLIEMKRKIRGSAHSDVGAELRAAKRRVSQMEMRQQTASLTIQKENELLGAIKDGFKRLRELEALKAEQDAIVKEIRDVDSGITELFQAAEKEHLAAVDLSQKARAVHAEATGYMRSIAALVADGDEKHEAYLAARTKADEVHAKVVEMREKVLTIRGARRAEAREARDILRKQNRSVRQTLYDEKKLEASADEALKALLLKGRVEIG